VESSWGKPNNQQENVKERWGRRDVKRIRKGALVALSAAEKKRRGDLFEEGGYRQISQIVGKKIHVRNKGKGKFLRSFQARE